MHSLEAPWGMPHPIQVLVSWKDRSIDFQFSCIPCSSSLCPRARDCWGRGHEAHVPRWSRVFHGNGAGRGGGGGGCSLNAGPNEKGLFHDFDYGQKEEPVEPYREWLPHIPGLAIETRGTVGNLNVGFSGQRESSISDQVWTGLKQSFSFSTILLNNKKSDVHRTSQSAWTYIIFFNLYDSKRWVFPPASSSSHFTKEETEAEKLQIAELGVKPCLTPIVNRIMGSLNPRTY